MFKELACFRHMSQMSKRQKKSLQSKALKGDRKRAQTLTNFVRVKLFFVSKFVFSSRKNNYNI